MVAKTSLRSRGEKILHSSGCAFLGRASQILTMSKVETRSLGIGILSLVKRGVMKIALIFRPNHCRQRKLIQLRSGFAPSWVVLVKKCHKTLAMRRLQQMHHFMNDDVFEEILRLFHKLGIETDVPRHDDYSFPTWSSFAGGNNLQPSPLISLPMT